MGFGSIDDVNKKVTKKITPSLNEPLDGTKGSKYKKIDGVKTSGGKIVSKVEDADKTLDGKTANKVDGVKAVGDRIVNKVSSGGKSVGDRVTDKSPVTKKTVSASLNPVDDTSVEVVDTPAPDENLDGGGDGVDEVAVTPVDDGVADLRGIDRSKKMLEDIELGLDPLTQSLVAGSKASNDAKQAAELSAQRQRMEAQGLSGAQQEANTQDLSRDLNESERKQEAQLSQDLAARQLSATKELAQIEDKESAEFKEKYDELKLTTDFSDPESVAVLVQASKDAYGEDFDIEGLIKEGKLQAEISAEKDFGAWLSTTDVSDYTTTTVGEDGKTTVDYDWSNPKLQQELNKLSEMQVPGSDYDFGSDPSEWSSAQTDYAEQVMRKLTKSPEAKAFDQATLEYMQSPTWDGLSVTEQQNYIELRDTVKELGATDGYTGYSFQGGIQVVKDSSGDVIYVEGGKPEDFGTLGNGTNYVKQGDNYLVGENKYSVDSDGNVTATDANGNPVSQNDPDFIENSAHIKEDIANTASEKAIEDFDYDNATSEQIIDALSGDNYMSVGNDIIDSIKNGDVMDASIYTKLAETPELYNKLLNNSETIEYVASGGDNRKHPRRLSLPGTGEPFNFGGKAYIVVGSPSMRTRDGKWGHKQTVLDLETGEEIMMYNELDSNGGISFKEIRKW